MGENHMDDDEHRGKNEPRVTQIYQKHLCSLRTFFSFIEYGKRKIE